MSISEIDDEVPPRFDLVEPDARVLADGGAREQLSPSETAERMYQAAGEILGVELRIAGENCKGLGHSSRILLFQRGIEARDRQFSEPEHGPWVVDRECVESLFGEPHQLAIAQAAYRRRARLAGDQRHLTHRLARGDPADQPGPPIEPAAESTEGAAAHDVERVCGIAFGEQHRATRQSEPLQFGGDGDHRALIEPLEQWQCRKHCNGVPPDAGVRRSFYDHIRNPGAVSLPWMLYRHLFQD